MKKKLVSLVLCMALLSSLTVSASADFTSTDSSNLSSSKTYLQNLWSELNPNLSSSYSTNLRKIVGQILAKLPSSDYADVLTSRASFNNASYSNFVVMLGNALTSIYNSSAGIAQRIVEVQTLITGTNNRVDTTNDRLSIINTNMQNLIAAASQQNHADWNSFLVNPLVPWYSFDFDTSSVVLHGTLSFPESFGALVTAIQYDAFSPYSGDTTLYHRIKMLQEVLASDDDLALKNANKANEEAVKSDFVSGSSSKTSLGASDFGNLKDVGGTFNDLTSLNGQAKVSSFLSGLSSADEVGQGWFSEACRASLDAVSQPASSGTRLVQKTWRGEKSLIYTLEADTSVVGVKSVAGVVGSDLDPYNMAGFEEKYSWLWGDASW